MTVVAWKLALLASGVDCSADSPVFVCVCVCVCVCCCCFVVLASPSQNIDIPGIMSNQQEYFPYVYFNIKLDMY